MGVALSNPDKVMYPSTGTTKADVVAYYRAVAGVLLPQIARRPVTRKRWVDGVGAADQPGKVFFRKDLEPNAPEWMDRAGIEHSTRTTIYPLLDSADGLAWLANLAALEFHTPQWRFSPGPDPVPQNPDRLVLDLDPGPGVELTTCATLAQMLRELVESIALSAFPVTSGSKGIHLYVPLDGSLTADDASAVAKRLATALEAERPDLVVADMKKSLRDGKILLDWSQNNGSKTTVAPYSLRGRERPTVACPRTWEEIADPELRHLEMTEVMARVAEGIDPLAPLGLTVVAPDRLDTYRSMRDPGKTPEPMPAPGDLGMPANATPIFVIQEHHASRLHFDVRIEHDGVLASWAVPKGPPLEGDPDRLALQTEDHPLAYATFEGEIPRGEYGAGHMTIWDHGTAVVEKWRDDEVMATLMGRPDGGLGGVPRRYVFARTGRGDDAKNWLLHLMASKPPQQVVGRATPTDLQPMLASVGSPAALRRGKDWTFEVKWDGVRCLATVEGNGLCLTSRSGKDMTWQYPEIGELVHAIDPRWTEHGPVVVDGEIVTMDSNDRPSFTRLQHRIQLTTDAEIRAAAQATPVHLMVFDILTRDGESLLGRPLSERRGLLAETVEPGDHIHIPAVLDGTFDEAMTVTAQLGLEGVMAKKADAIYRPGQRSTTWQKVKHTNHVDVVVIGWREGKGSRTSTMGSVLVATRDEDGDLHYAGRVGSGWTDKALDAAIARLTPLVQEVPAVDDVPALDRRDATWVRPELVGEVEVTEVTSTGKLRHPVWRGWKN